MDTVNQKMIIISELKFQDTLCLIHTFICNYQLCSLIKYRSAVIMESKILQNNNKYRITTFLNVETDTIRVSSLIQDNMTRWNPKMFKLHVLIKLDIIPQISKSLACGGLKKKMYQRCRQLNHWKSITHESYLAFLDLLCSTFVIQ